MRIGLLSDTHGFLDESIWRYFGQCDEIWHGGDFGPIDVLDRLRAFKPLRGVFGNIDGPEIRAELSEHLIWTTEGLKIYMTHRGGYPGHYEKQAKQTILGERPALFITGHSHILRVMRDPTLSLLHMNPGACGHVGWHKVRTMLRFRVEAGSISEVEARELDARGRGVGSA